MSENPKDFVKIKDLDQFNFTAGTSPKELKSTWDVYSVI